LDAKAQFGETGLRATALLSFLFFNQLFFSNLAMMILCWLQKEEQTIRRNPETIAMKTGLKLYLSLSYLKFLHL
jgi:hypothetical protein